MKIWPHTRCGGFTLIELLVVISIMALLAALIFPVAGIVKVYQQRSTAKAELVQIVTALDDYKAQYGVYPPSNPTNALLNPLYYELTGVTNVGGSTGSYQTLDNASTVPLSVYTSVFNIGGAINCTKLGTDTESAKAKSFLQSLRQNHVGSVSLSGNNINLLITSVRGPDSNYMPLGVPDVNPFRYIYPGTNNPNTYDLWIDLKINGKTYRISNWTQQVRIL